MAIRPVICSVDRLWSLCEWSDLRRVDVVSCMAWSLSHAPTVRWQRGELSVDGKVKGSFDVGFANDQKKLSLAACMENCLEAFFRSLEERTSGVGTNLKPLDRISSWMWENSKRLRLMKCLMLGLYSGEGPDAGMGLSRRWPLRGSVLHSVGSVEGDCSVWLYVGVGGVVGAAVS